MKKPIPFGKYLLIDRINVGGMAEVYKGKTVGVEGFEKLLAIKRILPNIAEDDEFITMFIDEAKISVQLSHANVAQIYDLGKISDSYYIAMEYISGKDVRAIFDRMRKRGEILPIPMTCFIVSRMCEGLDYAHRKKDTIGREMHIVHRDVSPQNVLVSFEGEVKIIDFGIAKAANKASKTQAGILKGKFGYMSPEQVRGLPLDRRSDVFAVGVVLYELLTGERLFVGESDFSVLEKVRNVDVVPPSTYNRRIPERLEQIVMKALAKDVDERYQWASELQDDLQRFLITSDSIFSRHDLANFMKAAFAEDLEREKLRNQQVMMGGVDDEAGGEPEPPPAPAPEVDRTELFDAGQRFGTKSDDDLTQPGPDPVGRSGPPSSRPLPPRAPGRPPPPRMSAAGGPPGAPQRPPPPVPGEHLAPGSLADLEDLLPGDEGIPTFAEGRRGVGAPPAMASGVPAMPPRAPARPIEERVRAPRHVEASERPPRSKLPVILGAAVLVLAAAAGGLFYFLPPGGGATGPGVLIVRGKPAGATVFVDGKRAGPLPFIDSKMPAGQHALRVEADGYAPFAEKISVLPGETAKVNVDMQRAAQPKASVLLVTVPLETQVLLDGQVVKDGGEEPWRAGDVEAGVEHRIVVRKPGFRDEVMTWTPEDGQDKTFTVKLAPSHVDVVVDSTPSRATVYLDGERKGRTPMTIQNVDSNADHRLKLVRGGCWADWESTLLLDAAAEKKVDVTLEKRAGCGTAPSRSSRREKSARPKVTPAAAAVPVGQGRLRLNTRPGWASVSVDGKDIGRQTPLIDYPLAAGAHTLTLRAANGNQKSVKVTIAPDQVTTKIVDMD